jgi:histone-lysine N-methyltransferase SETD2
MSKWMTLPDLGHAIATKYQREVVFLSKQGSCTLFPLRDSPTRTLDRLESIAFVHNCHFVRVHTLSILIYLKMLITLCQIII